jgi:hypothetical protein
MVAMGDVGGVLPANLRGPGPGWTDDTEGRGSGGRIHELLWIHRFLRFCGGDGSSLTLGFSGYAGYVDTSDPLVRTVLPDLRDTQDKGFDDTQGLRE